MVSDFKNILKDLRTEKGLSQDELAKEIHFSRSIVTKWECGRKIPSAEALIVLSQYFGVPTDYLLGLID